MEDKRQDKQTRLLQDGRVHFSNAQELFLYQWKPYGLLYNAPTRTVKIIQVFCSVDFPVTVASLSKHRMTNRNRASEQIKTA